MPRWKRPEHRRTNATRSRCLGSMLAWTLNTKPVTLSSPGSTVRASLGCGRGRGRVVGQPVQQRPHAEIAQAHCRRTPASGGPRGSSAARIRAGHPRPATAAPASSASWASRHAHGQAVAARGHHVLRARARCPRPAARSRGVARSNTPLKFWPMPIGQFMGAVSSASRSWISSSSSIGSRASRSILLMRVMIGMSRRRQTSNSFRVCGSMPLAASSTMIAESTAVSVR